MSKITFVDEPNKTGGKVYGRKRSAVAFIFSVTLLAIIVGFVGGILSLVIITNSSTGAKLRSVFGIKNIEGININSTTTNKLVLEESSAIIDAVKKASPAVVSISTSTKVQDLFGQVSEQTGGGTGFIVTSDGLIVTNKHVVSDKNAMYSVVTSEGKKYDGKVLALDSLNDLAIVSIEASGLPTVEFGDSENLQIGQWVVAVGNALAQFDNTVTVGVISAKNRQISATDSTGSGAETLSDLLQTDTAINPGNSGGPLINLKGQVIGINTAVAGNAQNIGFAIPINQVKNAIDFNSVRKTGKIIRPYIGVRYIPITPDIAKRADLPVDYGVYIYSGSTLLPAVQPNSPADKAGLRVADIIVEIDGVKINDQRTLNSILVQYKPDQEVEIKYMRGKDEKTVKLTLGATE